MKDILYLDNHETSRHLFAANLEIYTGANIIEFEHLDDAVEYLEGDSVEIIITRSQIDQRSADKKMEKIILQKGLNTKLIIIGKSKLSHYEATILRDPVDLKELVQVCAKFLGVTPSIMVESFEDSYYPIPIYLLLPGFQLVCSVYKLTLKGEFKEFLSKDHHVYKEVLVMLRDDDIDTIYVKANERLKFMSSLTVQTTEFLRNDRVAINEKLQVVEKGHEMVRNMAKKMMIDSETIQLADASIDTMVSIVDQINTLKELLNITFEDNMDFVYRHCLLISYIGAHIIKSMEWGTRDQQVKIAFVSFFHDIALQNKKLVRIHSDKELEAANITQEEKLKVKNHAVRSAKFLAKYHNCIPFGAEVIIKQHHGSRDGIGLSNLSQNISPLAIVFIVAEEWALFALNNEKTYKDIKRSDIITYIKNKYNLPAFKKVIAALDLISI